MAPNYDRRVPAKMRMSRASLPTPFPMTRLLIYWYGFRCRAEEAVRGRGFAEQQRVRSGPRMMGQTSPGAARQHSQFGSRQFAIAALPIIAPVRINKTC